MKKLTLMLPLIFAFAGCTEIVFTEPQPMGLANIEKLPESWAGKYAFVVLNNEESVEVGENFIGSKEEKSYLSDSVILRKSGDIYFLNKKMRSDSETNGKWSVQMIEEKGCGFLKVTGFYGSDDDEVKQIVEKYNGKLLETGKGKVVIIEAGSETLGQLMKDHFATMAIILERLEN
jgi:hypothetical protein